LRINWKFNF